MLPSLQEVLSEFSYEPATGEFTRLARTHLQTMMKSNEYRMLNVGGRSIHAHRIAWLIVTGQWPKQRLDHINGNPADNRFGNLRLASVAQNAQNKRVAITNKCGAKGVSFDQKRRKYCAFIQVDGRQKILGRFGTKEAAAAAYRAAALEHFGQFARI